MAGFVPDAPLRKRHHLDDNRTTAPRPKARPLPRGMAKAVKRKKAREPSESSDSESESESEIDSKPQNKRKASMTTTTKKEHLSKVEDSDINDKPSQKSKSRSKRDVKKAMPAHMMDYDLVSDSDSESGTDSSVKMTKFVPKKKEPEKTPKEKPKKKRDGYNKDKGAKILEELKDRSTRQFAKKLGGRSFTRPIKHRYSSSVDSDQCSDNESDVSAYDQTRPNIEQPVPVGRTKKQGPKSMGAGDSEFHKKPQNRHSGSKTSELRKKKADARQKEKQNVSELKTTRPEGTPGEYHQPSGLHGRTSLEPPSETTVQQPDDLDRQLAELKEDDGTEGLSAMLPYLGPQAMIGAWTCAICHYRGNYERYCIQCGTAYIF